MRENLPAILFLIPFLFAISMPLVGPFRRAWCWPMTLFAFTAMSLVSLFALEHVLSVGSMRYALSGWEPPIGIEWLLDGLSGIVTVMISLLALVTVFYAGPEVRVKLVRKEVPFYTLVLLLVSALTGMVMAADLFNLFVFLEVASLSAYALVAVAGGRAMLSAFRYLILGTIGASFYLLGVAYLYACTGTLNMADLAGRLPPLLESKAVLSGIVFIIIGLGIKMALVPLHGWLPDAYAHAMEGICPLIASLMTKVALYALIRIAFWVLGPELVWEEVPFMVYLGWIGAMATLVGAFLALSEPDIKRMFAYGGLSHIGLVILAVSLGNPTGFSGGIYYLVIDAVMQAGLFFVAGVIIYRYGINNMADLVHFGRGMPWTVTALIVVAMSMIGIPPTGGFFGKWYILLGALESENYVAVGVIIVGTLLTLAYFARIIEKMFLQARQASSGPGPEAPLEMRWGMAAVSAALILTGVFSDPAISLISRLASPPGM